MMYTENLGLDCQVALITGGAGAIGRAIGEGLVKVGARVVLVDSDERRLAQFGRELAASHGQGSCLSIVADVRDSQQVKQAFELALKECLAVSRVIPYLYNPLLRVADYYRMEGKREEAKTAYRRCLVVEENPYAHVKLGLALLEEENAAEAAKELEMAIRVNGTFHDPFRPEGSSGARYLLGVAYAKMGKMQEAKNELNRALAINPKNADARDVLNQIENASRQN